MSVSTVTPVRVVNPIDAHVGSRIRLRRTLLGMSQEKLGEAIGLTFQQVQKYERGANRVSASKLWALSHVLDVPVSFFFDDMPADVAAHAIGADDDGEEPGSRERDPLTNRETLNLVRNFARVTDDGVRKALSALVKASAEACEPVGGVARDLAA